MSDILNNLKNKASALPNSPGVYLMKNKSQKIIYVGKAKMLVNRVSQYFMSQSKHPEKVRQMVENVYDFDYIVTDSEFEALILECNLIKQYSPKYNILLKDDKGYHYIKISNSEWPKITAEKQKTDYNGKYFGPYMSAWVVNQSVDKINKTFMLPTCNKNFKEGKSVSKPCLNYYIKQCCAPCRGKISKNEYKEYINDAIDYISGKTKIDIKKMQQEMYKYSENMEFEKAAKIRDRINAVKQLSNKQKFVAVKVENLDVIALKESESNFCLVVFRFKDFTLYDKEDFIIKNLESCEKTRSDFIKQYYTIRDNIPENILVDGDIEDKDMVEKFLSEKKGKRVKINMPKKGEMFKLVSLCQKNATEKLAQKENRTWKEDYALEQIKQLLNLDFVPKIIESYDISNLKGSENVAGMVVFKNAKPYKKSYRKFQIKTVIGQDDYASMREVVSRRFCEYEKHKGEDSGFGVLPDLILLDGGRTHVLAIKPILEQFGLNIPVFGMVKDSKHKTKAIASDGSEIAITNKREAFTLISKIQEEVHRFAVSYHRTKRSKTISSQLLKIRGIGSKKAGILLKRFKTISNIKNADIEDLVRVEKITKANAEDIYNFFNKDEQ
ncbi:MAG: excinuclease ABC subunit UvrC [Clostridia bacterium]|nr:excinuclease ABC subunit UvrC [Clostridia bacterium]